MSTRVEIPRNGRTVKEAAESTGLSTVTSLRWTSEPREEYLARANEKRRKVRKLRAQGLSIRAIARETGYSVGTVHRFSKDIHQ